MTPPFLCISLKFFPFFGPFAQANPYFVFLSV
jgi:hypothetical protein